MFTDAMPVLAVTPSASDGRPPHAPITARSSTDLPVPAEPVKKTECPARTRASTRSWSGESAIGGGAGPAAGRSSASGASPAGTPPFTSGGDGDGVARGA